MNRRKYMNADRNWISIHINKDAYSYKGHQNWVEKLFLINISTIMLTIAFSEERVLFLGIASKKDANL